MSQRCGSGFDMRISCGETGIPVASAANQLAPDVADDDEVGGLPFGQRHDARLHAAAGAADAASFVGLTTAPVVPERAPAVLAAEKVAVDLRRGPHHMI